MRHFTKIFALLILVSALTGCSRGIDKEYIAKAALFARADEGFELTLAPAVGDSLSVKSATLDGAKREVLELSGKELYTGQTEIILLERSLAEEDVSGIIDALYLSSQRQNMERVVICEANSKEMMQEAPTEVISALESLRKSSAIAPATVRSICMASKAIDGCALVPYLSGDGAITQYALIQNGKMTCLLGEEQTRGAGYMNGQKNDFFTMNVGGDLRDVAVSDVECDVSFSDVDGYSFVINVSMKCDSSAAEGAREYVRQCIESAAAAAKARGADFIGMAGRVLNVNADLKEKYADNWSEVVQNARYVVRVSL